MDYYNNKHRKQKLAGMSAVQYRPSHYSINSLVKSFWGTAVKRPTTLLP
ncbi:hypothetical protein [Peribacillus frigoritolerans]